MKFYSAEMVNRWNNAAGVDEEAYDREWDEAQNQYEEHYARLADGFPASVRKFSELVLHNETAIVLPVKMDREGRVAGYVQGEDYTIVSLSQLEQLVHVLTYTLEKPPVVEIRYGGGFDPPENPGVWLYDEFDVDDQGLFIHRVLFSNGVELAVTFKTLHWYETVIQAEG